MRRIIFYHPKELLLRPLSGSQLRPKMMLESFLSSGLTVDLVCGNAASRSQGIKRIKNALRSGAKYEFAYFEDSSRPMFFLDGRVPQLTLYDLRFLYWLKTKQIPVGMFYRDIHWRIREISSHRWSWIKFAVAQAAFTIDLHLLNKALTRLYLPSIEMASHLPEIDPDIIRELPPGHGITLPRSEAAGVTLGPNAQRGLLNLLYVGGLNHIYRLHAVVDAVSKISDVRLTICTRERCWKEVSPAYQAIANMRNTEVVHAAHSELASLYQSADIAVLSVQPNPVWSFASPVKYYEYLGWGLPVLATEGTRIGRLVTDTRVGWAVDYSPSSIEALLRKIIEDPQDLAEKAANARTVGLQHTWQARSDYVTEDLTALNKHRHI